VSSYCNVRSDCKTGKWHRHACNLESTRTSFANFYAASLFGSFKSDLFDYFSRPSSFGSSLGGEGLLFPC